MANASSNVVGLIEVDSSISTVEELTSILANRPSGGPVPKTVNRILSGERTRCQESEIWSTAITVWADTRRVEEDFKQEYVEFNQRLSIVRASR